MESAAILPVWLPNRQNRVESREQTHEQAQRYTTYAKNVQCGLLSGWLGTRTGAVNAPMSGTSAAELFQLVPQRCSCPVEADSGISGRYPYFIRDGRYVCPFEVDTTDQVGILWFQ